MKLSTLALCVLIAGCAVAPQGPNRYELEFKAYTDYLSDEIHANRISATQATFLIQQKRNQLISQQQADRAASSANTMNTLHLLNQMQRAQQPTFLPNQGINCTSFNVNGILNTNCR